MFEASSNKMKAPPGTLPIKMKDEGFYDQHSQTQRAIIEMTLPYLDKALDRLSLPKETERFVIVDYGCSEGENSVQVVSKIIETIQHRQNNQLFNTVFNDLPQNNFNRLFENLSRYGLKENPAILTFASGQAFHKPVMPARTVHFGYSSSAAHWLTELPNHAIKNHVYLSGATPEEKNKLSKVAAQDWQNFLNARAVEMTPGARILITMGANPIGKTKEELLKIGDEEGNAFNSRKGPAETYPLQIIMDLINEIMRDLVKEKKISSEQAANICFPVYPRSMDEVLLPLKESDLKDKFVIEEAQILEIACPLFKQYLQNNDSEGYANSLTALFRAFLEPLILHQLYDIKERRRSGRKQLPEQMVIDELFARMKLHIKAKPEYYTFFPVHSLLILARK